jgi:hypothetical protein
MGGSPQAAVLEAVHDKPCSPNPKPVPLETQFPGAKGPVEVTWVTGRFVARKPDPENLLQRYRDDDDHGGWS